jgi:hypothetical protein
MDRKEWSTARSIKLNCTLDDVDHQKQIIWGKGNGEAEGLVSKATWFVFE